MAGYTKGTRVGYGESGGKKMDQRSGDLKQDSSVGAAQAKVPVNGVQNEAREKNSSAEISTRKTTGSK